MAPFFSIIVPCYNVEEFIEEALKSLQAQDFQDWECCAVDDGSKDSTGAILDEFSRNDPRFKIIHQPNAGVGKARNAGLKIASGEWIGFLDGDDLFAPCTLSHCYRAIKEYPNMQIAAFERYAGQSPEDISLFCGDYSSRMIDCRTEIPAVLCDKAPCTQFYKRDIAQHAFSNFSLGEDRLWNMEAIVKAEKAVYLDEQLYFYRCRPGSAMRSSLTVKKIQDDFLANKEILHQVTSSQKHVNSRFLSQTYRRIIIYTCDRYLSLAAGQEIHQPYQDYLSSLKEVISEPNCPLYYRLWYSIRMFGGGAVGSAFADTAVPFSA